MPLDPVEVRAPRRMLWVEGKDDSAVVQSLCRQHTLPEVFRVKDKTGVAEILRGLRVEIRATELERFGIVVDADGDAATRWNAIRDRLLRVGYANVPPQLDPEGALVAEAGTLPRFGAWIMPNNAAPGMLEDFAAGLVPAGNFLWGRAGEVIDQLSEEHRRFAVSDRSKAHIHTWLAWQVDPGSPMGRAITRGDLDANAPPAQAFVSWLRRLFID